MALVLRGWANAQQGEFENGVADIQEGLEKERAADLTLSVLDRHEYGPHAPYTAARTIAAVPSPALAVPASLYASLMARLDRLGGPAKEVAQIAAPTDFDFRKRAGTSTVCTTSGNFCSKAFAVAPCRCTRRLFRSPAYAASRTNAWLELTPEQRRQKTLEALTAQMETLSRQKPVLLLQTLLGNSLRAIKGWSTDDVKHAYTRAVQSTRSENIT
jgi:hypothetical protein